MSKQVLLGGGFLNSLNAEDKAAFLARVQRIIPDGYEVVVTNEFTRCRVVNDAYKSMTAAAQEEQKKENYLIQNLFNKEERMFQRERIAFDPSSPDYVHVRAGTPVPELVVRNMHVSLNTLILRAMGETNVAGGNDIDVYNERDEFVATITIPYTYRRP